ncbi:MAG: cysteine desulfurase [Thermoprotei archaeon]|nr:MAG: cysteine desulfurase [Thermoprotei archaeon]
MSIKALLKAHGTPLREVYFDLENSPFVPREVVEAMLPYFNKYGYGNPAITHKPGWEAYDELLQAKEFIARTIGASPEEITFTHSGTEANNLAILGTALKFRKDKRKILISAIEHLSVTFAAEHASKLLGHEVLIVPVDEEGFIDSEVFEAYMSKDVFLVSIQAVNHEIGTIQNIKELVKIARDYNPDIIFHMDAAEAYGRIKFNVKDLGVDLVTLSSSKIHGPKGVGVLFIRSGIDIEPIIKGQISVERFWPGSENIPAIMGFRKAVELAFNNFESNVSKMRELRDKLMKGALEEIPYVLVNGPRGDKRAPDNVNLSFLYIEGEALTIELSLRGVYVSSASACTSRILEPSHILLAIGRKYEEAHGSILFKISRYHSEEDISYTLENLSEAVERLRRISPLKGDEHE